jgi:PAS domain S-box-containing protein
VKSLDEGYYSCSLSGIVLDHNISFNRILGIDLDMDVKGAKLPDFWQNPADRLVYLDELKAKGLVTNYQIKAKKGNGEHIHVIANAHFVMGENGKPIRIDGTFIDITDLKQTEEALLLKNYVFDASIAANSIADTNGIITEANDSFLRVWGYPSKEEVIGKPLLHFIKDPAEGGAIVTDLNALGRWEGNYTAKRKDGSTFVAHGFATTLRDGSGKLIGYQSAVLDVTKERQNAKELADYRESLETLVTQRTSQLTESEKKFRTLIDFAYEWEYWVDPSLKFVYVSPSCERITGYTPEEFYKDPTLMDRLLHPDSISVFQKHSEDSHKDNKSPRIHELELKMIDKKGKEHWIVHVCRPIIDDKDRFLGRRVSNRDITERKRSDEIIRQNTALLETANKELEAFAYSVSHDLRAPLRTIDGFSQALLEDCNDKIDETGKDHIARVRAATQKMGELIDDILNLSRINRMGTTIQTIDLSGIVRAIEKELRNANPEREVEFIIAPDVRITGDLNLIRIALENLIVNAWKFTSKNDRAKIEFGVQKKGETNIYFVRDDGAGFDMTFADKLFIPFQRLHSVTEFPGTGIGLALVQRIVHKHYGKIWAEGAKGQGATFYFTIFEEKRAEVLK